MNRRGLRAEGSTRSVPGAPESDEYRSRPPGGLGEADDDDEALLSGEGPSPVDEGPVELVVSVAQHGLRLDRLLAAAVPRHSRSHLQSLIEAGAVAVDDLPALQPARRVSPGQRVRVSLALPLSQRPFEPESMRLDLRHVDAHLYVLCKPAGLVVHPAAGHWRGTLLNGLLGLDPALASLPRAGIVHRLDKDTSGLMVVARSTLAMTGLVRALARHEVRRVYRAIVQGVPPAGLSRVDQPIGRDPRVRTRMAVVASGKPARTDLTAMGSDGRFTRIECRLHTGRTHQIRVHLAHCGHPLVGDALYGGPAALGMDRQALHARELGFRHPVSDEPIQVQAEPPDDFRAAWDTVVPD